MQDKYLDRPCGCNCRPERFWRDALVMMASCCCGFFAAGVFLWFFFVAVWPW